MLEELGRLDAPVILTSHGPVLRDGELLELETRMLRTLVDEDATAVAVGKTLKQTQASVTLSDFREQYPNATEAVKAAVERAYQEAVGELEH